MKNTQIRILLLALIFSLQARAQTDSLSVTQEPPITENSFVENSEEEELQVRVKGFLDTYHAVSTENLANWMSSRTRARGELNIKKNGASIFLSLNAIYNGILKQRTGIELQEAYLSYEKGNLDLRSGRQIVVWGVADALRVTDYVSPFDYTEFLAQDYDDIRIPVNAIRAKYTYQSVTFEALCIPVSSYFILPTDKHNPWAILPPSITPLNMDIESGKPSRTFKNMEYGGRIIFNLSGMDFSLSALRTWNKMPAFSYRLSSDKKSLNILGNYHRMTILGEDCSLPFGEIVIRSEAAVYLGEAQSAKVGYNVERRHCANALVGIDWFAGHDWNISVQYYHKYIAGEIENLSVFRNNGLATARISKELLGNTLKFSDFAYIDVTDGGVFNRLSASYSLNDQTELTIGYDFFHAEEGKFAIYKHNSELWVKMKYSF